MASEASSGSDLGKPQFASHKWLEPILVLSIMIGSVIINRHRDFSIMGHRHQRQDSKSLLDHEPDLDDLDFSAQDSLTSNDTSCSKKRNCFGRTITTPNTYRFRNNLHSRFLQKFPFLVEMFYWAMNYCAYSITKGLAAAFYDGRGNGVVELAQQHGISILWFEHESWARVFFPLKEVAVQTFFLSGHTSAMTLLNRVYSLVHIPGTVLFLSWYYRSAPDHRTFAIARRTMTLANFAAFFVFAIWPCMPPRLLPKSFGFHDTVRQGSAESVWVGGKNVNQLAAMPSLHFTYAFITGCTFFYHSKRQRLWKKVLLLAGGLGYPMFVLLVIVSTANHYYMDAVVATLTVTLSFLCNRAWNVLLPVEDWFCWIIRLEKPKPTTGMR